MFSAETRQGKSLDIFCQNFYFSPCFPQKAVSHCKNKNRKTFFVKTFIFLSLRFVFLQKLAPAWDELGAAFEDDKKVTIAKLDCTQAQSVCQSNDVKGYPTLAYFRNGKKVENYRGAR